MFETLSKLQYFSRISSPFKGQQKENLKSSASQPKPKVEVENVPLTTNENSDQLNKTVDDIKLVVPDLKNVVEYPEYTLQQYKEEFLKSTDTANLTSKEDMYFNTKRKWKCIISVLKLKTISTDYKLSKFFLEWEIGNQRIVRVKDENVKSLYTLGNIKHIARTNLIYDEDAILGSKNINFRNSFEYKGSYKDINSDDVHIKLWQYMPRSLNTLVATSSKKLVDVCNGSIQQEIQFNLPVKGEHKLCRILTYNFYFQEIYHFKLEFFDWRIYGFQTSRELQFLLKQHQHELKLQKKQKRNTTTKNNTSDWRKNDVKKNDEGLNLTPTNTTLNNQPLAKKPAPIILSENQNVTEISSTTDAQLLQCIPRIMFKLKQKSFGYPKVRLVSQNLRNTILPYWSTVGSSTFHGTIYDLSTSTLYVEINDLQTNSFRVVGLSEIYLRGIIDQIYVEAPLRLPPWFLDNFDTDIQDNYYSSYNDAFIEGKISIKSLPQYRQSGETENVDLQCINLFVHIQNIDKVLTAENLKNVYPYVEVTLDTDTRYTQVVTDCQSPVFDSILIFPIYIDSKEKSHESLQNTKNHISINTWSKGDTYNEHCGGTVFLLYDLYHDEKGLERPFEYVSFTDGETGTVLRDRTRKIQLKRKLSLTFPSQSFSTLTFSCWTIPDLLKNTRFKLKDKPKFSSLPPFLFSAMDELELKFEDECIKTASMLEPYTRYYYCYTLDQKLAPQFICSFVGKVVPPKKIDNCYYVAHYIHCLKFIQQRKKPSDLLQSNDTLTFGKPSEKVNLTRVWATPAFTLNARCGSIFDHALLHASFLIGLGELAFVCLGSLWDTSHHIWVCTFHLCESTSGSYGYVKFWETTTNASYTLNNRFMHRHVIMKNMNKTFEKRTDNPTSIVDKIKGITNVTKIVQKIQVNKTNFIDAEFTPETEKADDLGRPLDGYVKMPYRSLDMMFNHHNIWVNKQDPNPNFIWFDVWSTDYWYQFFSGKFNIKTCFPRGGNYCMVQYHRDLQQTVDLIKLNCRKSFSQYRRSRNMQTRWNDDVALENFLVYGLKLIHEKDIADLSEHFSIENKHKKWRQILYQKLPPTFRLKSFTLHLNTTNTRKVADSFVHRCSFIDMMSNSTTFTLAVQVNQLPLGLTSVYVMILLIYNISRRERQAFYELNLRKNGALHTMEMFNRTYRKRLETEIEIKNANDNVRIQRLGQRPNDVGKKSFDNDATKITVKSTENVKKGIDSFVKGDQKSRKTTPTKKKLSHSIGSIRTKQGKKKKIIKSLRIRLPRDAILGTIYVVKFSDKEIWNNLTMFRFMMSTVNQSLCQALRVSKKKIKCFACNYTNGTINFAVLPSDNKSVEADEKLFSKLIRIFASLCENSPQLKEIIGSSATIAYNKKIEHSTSITVMKIKEALHETVQKRKREQNKTEKHLTVPSVGKQNKTSVNDTNVKTNDILAQNYNLNAKEALNEEENRRVFCKRMQEEEGEIFEQLRKYYENEGYSNDESQYFAAYYTALRIKQCNKS
ncbi:uncharacterized protein LOC128882864 isoform X2 [Hylaeus volcanicus]|uniref:uncharacterized protein LOC128882864 isoform X2 n=1 Tax=Hylaeus volcanicus TaxID=313075 RepID=UPI0023B8368D|nr:uncharacterized protein LOC128882864 isoform X2 [Hylaeus volcanicus]